MSGLMVGILLSRPAASFLAGTWSWKGFENKYVNVGDSLRRAIGARQKAAF